MSKEVRVIRLKLDIIFKRMFGTEGNEDLLTALVAALLDIPRESIKSIELKNVEMPPEYYGNKFSRLDLKLTVDDKVVNIEIQVNAEQDFKDRTLFYWARMFSDELGSGDSYGDLKKTICLNIVNFDMFDCNDYHSCFLAMEQDRGEMLSDKFAIHFFELRKLSKCRKDKPMDEWLRVINAETEDELMEIMQTTQIPEIKRTIVKLREMSADEKLREEARLREMSLRDEISALKGAENKGVKKERQRTIENMRRAGFTEEQIRLAIGEDTDF